MIINLLKPAAQLPPLNINNWVLRGANHHDMDDIYLLGLDAWGDGDLAAYMAGCRGSAKYQRGSWYVLEHDGQIVSAIICYSLPTIAQLTIIGLGSLATRPDQRQKGYASTLLNAIMAHYQRQQHTDVFMLFDETGGHFYQRAGFQRLPAHLQSQHGASGMIHCREQHIASIHAHFKSSQISYF